MSIQPFKFTPPDGLLNRSSFPTNPKDEEAARMQFQVLFNQIADYLNLYNSAMTSANGAGHIASAPISGVSGNTVHEQIASLAAIFYENFTGSAGSTAIGNSMLAPDICVGSLASLATAVKTSVTAAINDVAAKTGNYSAVFKSSGTFSAPRTGLYKVTVQAGGGGGCGGFGAAAYEYQSYLTFYSGGGGGGCAVKWVNLSAGENVPVTVGLGGNGGVAPTARSTNASPQINTQGTAGGTSSFGSYCSATGGGTGYQCTEIFNQNQRHYTVQEYMSSHINSGGQGGSGVNGDLNFTGGAGSSCAEAYMHEPNHAYLGTSAAFAGGDSHLGGGGRAFNADDCTLSYSSISSINGNPGTGAGGGGAGGRDKGVHGIGVAGGKGAGGVVLVEYSGYCA